MGVSTENASVTFSKEMCQGINSFADGYVIDLKELQSFKVPRVKASRYGGFVPVNFPHMYTVKVVALDRLLVLKEGYMYNELLQGMIGHVVGEGTLHGIYNASIKK